MRTTVLAVGLLLVGCRGEGNWALRATGGEAATSGVNTTAFADGCAAVFETFELNILAAELIDEDGESAGGIELPARVDLVDAEVVDVAVVPVAAGGFESVALKLGSAELPAVSTTGFISCDSGTVAFDWSFVEQRQLACAASELSIPDKGEGSTELQVRVEALFVEGANPTSDVLWGEPFIEADTNHDGELRLLELEEVSVEGLPLDELMEVRVDGLVRSEGGAVCTASGA